MLCTSMVYISLRRVHLQSCWFIPFYIISLILTTVWFQDIAEHSFTAYYHRKPAGIVSVSGMIR